MFSVAHILLTKRKTSVFDRSATVASVVWHSQEKNIFDVKKLIPKTGRVYYCNNSSPSNACFEGVSLRPCIFKFEKDRQFFELFIKNESWQGSQYLLETVSDGQLFIALLSWLMKYWLRWSVLFCKDSILNFVSLVCFKEFLTAQQPQKEQYL